MGIVDIDNLDPMSPHIPFYPVNYYLANQCYLIIHDPNDLKIAHMSILIDLGGNGPNQPILG